MWARLGELGAWYGGGTPSKSRPDFWTHGSTPWLSPKDMGPEVISATQDHITDAAVVGSAVRLVPPNSVAIVTRSGILERMVPVALVPFATTLNQDMKAIYADERVITARWIAWALRAMERQVLKECRKAGTTVASLSTTALMDLRIPVAPLAEQHRIVEALEDHLSRLDAATHSLSVVERRISSLRASAFSTGLRVGKVPSGWTLSTIGELATVGTGATPLKSRTDYYAGGTVPWVTSSLLNAPLITESDRYITDLAVRETSVRIYPAGTILVAMYGEGKTRGKSAELTFPATTNQACAAIVLHEKDEFRKPWIKLALESKYNELRRLASGGVQPNLNLGLIRAIQIPLPPPVEQDQILTRMDELSTGMNRLRDSAANIRSRSAHLRKSILRRAFRGQLVPQDPADEPAPVLLDRIRAEREAQGGKVKRGTRRPRKAAEAVPPPAPASTPSPATAVQQELPL
ncbi:restriction endonuclease subunit S [Streptomyces sp. fd1-xmd]|uniref:restriction endonuclease subunit S n=1 Tax=Streptomyces sp. fd1-xmd TaxID=1812480 RepID=UPI0009C33D91|nr:restriction endonuclease subunit S [Streptomyces sp. fd1-xmd]AQT74426.1 hypothetical protein B1K54_24710 [Streptomyces sp. fd1-xmd]